MNDTPEGPRTDPQALHGLRTDAQITLIEGNADRFKLEAVHALAAAWLGEELEYGLTQVDAREAGLTGVVKELSSGSLISSRRVLVIRDVTSLPAREQQELAKVLQGLQPETAVVLVVAKQGWDPRNGSPGLSRSLTKLAEAHGQAATISGPPAKGLVVWVSRQMQRLGKRIDAEAARLLVDTTGEDVDRLLSEMDKLVSYVGARAEVTEADVAAVSVATSEEKVWEFLDAVGARNGAAALRLLDGMLPPGSDRGAAIMLLGSLARQLRLLWQVHMLHTAKVLPGSLAAIPPEVAARLPAQQSITDAVRGRDWLLRKFSEQAERFRDGDLARALDRVYRADQQLKGQGARQDDRTTMELLVVELCDADRAQE